MKSREDGGVILCSLSFYYSERKEEIMSKVTVQYGHMMNAWLGGVLFRQGVAVFDNEKEGIEFANRFNLSYEVEAPKKKPAPKKKRSVKK